MQFRGPVHQKQCRGIRVKITPKLNNNVKYGSNLMNFFFKIFVFILGVLGKRMLNPEVLKCHEDLITLDTYVQQGKAMDNVLQVLHICENINIFGYMGARGGGGGGDFNNQTGLILVHIYPLFNNNLHVKCRSNLIRTFGVKIQNMKKKKIICQQMQNQFAQQGKQFENQFFI